MIFSAVLSNAYDLWNDVATIPFPLERGEYDHSIGVLAGLGMGDALQQDCRVESIKSSYPVLQKLVGQNVNVDELDYLAKRLDSFMGDDDMRFMAMAEKLQITDIKDFINLTFCFQQAAVISCFNDLEAVGKAHYMDLHGGCATHEELAALDGEQMIRSLIAGGKGMVTPYGVVYDNGFKLEQSYTGGQFPPYLYEAYSLVMAVSSESQPEETLIYLPSTKLQIVRTLRRGGIDPDGKLLLRSDMNDLPAAVNNQMYVEQKDLFELNAMCAAIKQIQNADVDIAKFNAVVSFVEPTEPGQVATLAAHLGDFEFIPDISSETELGEYMIRDSGHFEYDEKLDDFYNYQAFGEDYSTYHEGLFVDNGYVSYCGDGSIKQLMDADMEEQSVEMGGMNEQV